MPLPLPLPLPQPYSRPLAPTGLVYDVILPLKHRLLCPALGSHNLFCLFFGFGRSRRHSSHFEKKMLRECIYLSLVLLLISDLTNGLCLHQFLVTKSAEANKSVKTDANGAH